MAFTIEDGTGIAGANAYVDVAYANAYFTERNNSAWIGTDHAKQAAIIQATDYIEMRFASLFRGTRKTTVQELSFPRIDKTFGEMPTALKRACCEYAVRSLTAKLTPDPVIHESGQGLERSRKRVGPIEKEVRLQYQGPGTIRLLLRPYPAADMLIKPLLTSSSGSVIRG